MYSVRFRKTDFRPKAKTLNESYRGRARLLLLFELSTPERFRFKWREFVHIYIYTCVRARP